MSKTLEIRGPAGQRRAVELTDDGELQEVEPYRPNCYLYREVRDGLRMGWSTEQIIAVAARRGMRDFTVEAVERCANYIRSEQLSAETETAGAHQPDALIYTHD